MKHLLFLAGMLFSFTTLLAQAPEIEWSKTYGGGSLDRAEGFDQTRDGGYIIVGMSDSDDGDITENLGKFDFWVLKTDALGNVEWSKTYGGSDDDKASSVMQTNDGGYIVAGVTKSTDGDVSGFHGGWGDAWVIKIDSMGTLEWQKTFGGESFEIALDIRQTADGGYIFCGNSDSYGGDLSGNMGESDGWVVKLDASGDIEWQKSYGGNSSDILETIRQTSDGGYIAAGTTRSTNGDLSINKGSSDAWVFKIDSLGNLQWQKTYGGSNTEWAQSIKVTNDGGYIFVGETRSDDGDISENKGLDDCWIVKIDSIGNILWDKTYGGSNEDAAYSVWPTTDRGYIFAGGVSSDDGDVSAIHGSDDIWVVKVDENGEIEWEKTFGGDMFEAPYSIQQTPDEGYIILGTTRSDNGDVVGYKGDEDAWMFKLAGPVDDEEPNGIENEETQFAVIYPNPASKAINIKGHSNIQSVTVTDLLGRIVIVQESNSNQLTVNIAHLNKGIYIIELIDIHQQKQHSTFIKQ